MNQDPPSRQHVMSSPGSPRPRRKTRSAQDARAQRRRIFTYGLLAFSFVLMVNALVGENGYLATVRAEREYDEVTRALDAVRRENTELADHVDRLRHDEATLEETARRSLSLIRPGEKLIILRDAEPAQPPPKRR